MVEGARLESVYTGNRIEGSNPFLSAVFLISKILLYIPVSVQYLYEILGLWPFLQLRPFFGILAFLINILIFSRVRGNAFSFKVFPSNVSQNLTSEIC